MFRPADPPLPGDRAVHGSRCGVLDKAAAAGYRAGAAAVQTYFASSGFGFASDIFRVYLDNPCEGFVYQIRPEDVERVVATPGAQAKVEEALEAIRDQARCDPQVGVVRELASGWLGADPHEGDLYYAIGHYDVAVGSDTVVHERDGGLEAEITYRIYIYEFYNFDEKAAALLDVGTHVNNEMRFLEEAGWARSFRVHGETAATRTWTGRL